MTQKYMYKLPPRGLEQDSLKGDGNITYESDPVKGWPESGTDSDFCPELAEIIDRWECLPDAVKQSIIELVRSSGADKS